MTRVVTSVAVGLTLIAGSVALASGPAGTELDAVKLRVKPSDKRAMIAAVEGRRESISVILYVKKNGEFKPIASDRAPQVSADDGPVRITATQAGDTYERNGGQGTLRVGDDYTRYFGWNVGRKEVVFF